MKKLFIICSLMVLVGALSACCKCEVEPIVAENHALIVPKDFGNKPK